MDKILNEISFQWHITDLCNFRCKHCYQDNFSSERDLPVQEIKRILENLGEQFQKIFINITGGEPFLKRDFFEIIETISNCEFVEGFNIITNGVLLTREKVEILKKYPKLKGIKVSIEGIKSNDFIRGKGCLNTVRKNMEKIEGIKKIIMWTAGSYNYKEIEDVYEFARRYGDGLIIERFVPLGNGIKLKEHYLKKEEWKFVVEFIREYFLIEDIKELAKFRAFYLDFENEEVSGALCEIGNTFALMPDGSIYPCRRLPVKIGNALWTKNIKEKIENFRKEIEKNLKGKCSKCFFFNECIGCRAGVYSMENNLFSQDEQCFLT
jgi:radical SAM protein with 4Fe4S-binding SPASM domain